MTYLTSDFEPSFGSGSEILAFSHGTIFINNPPFDEVRTKLKEFMAKGYSELKDEFGYVKVADLREKVCRNLRIGDSLFDDYVKRLYLQEPHWLSFTYSGAADKITDKRLPIIFDKPTRQFFTLVKVNLGRE